MACNPLVSHGNLLDFQNRKMRASFGDMALPPWFGGVGEGWEVSSRLLPGFGHSFSALNCELTVTCQVGKDECTSRSGQWVDSTVRQVLLLKLLNTRCPTHFTVFVY